MFNYDKFESLRKKRGITKAYIASQLHRTPSICQDWKNNKSKPNIAQIATVARILGTTPEYLTDKTDEIEIDTSKANNNSEAILSLSDNAKHIAALFDLADEMDRRIVERTLAPYEKDLPKKAEQPAPVAAPAKIVPYPKVRTRKDGFTELTVYDDGLPAAGYGSYFDTPTSHIEQYPLGIIPSGTSFGVPISGNSMEPRYRDHATAFIQSAPLIEPGEIGVFSLNGEPYIKQLIKDNEKHELRLHSINPDYQDITVHEFDDLRTFGRVLGAYPAM